MIPGFIMRLRGWAVTRLLAVAILCLPAVGSATEQSLGQLLEQLQRPREAVARIRAAEALAHYGEAAVSPLRRLLRHDDEMVRYYACLAFVRLGPRAEAAVPDLIGIVGDPGESEDLRDSAIIALGQIGPAASSALPVLQAILHRRPSLDLRKTVLSALVAFATSEAVAILIERLERGERQEQLIILAAFWQQGAKATPAAGELLAFGARHPDRELRDRVFLTVATFGRDVTADLVPYLQADRTELRRCAALALSRLGPEAVAAVPMLCETLNDTETLVRFWAAKALGNMGPHARWAAASLLRVLDDRDPNVRWEATTAIARIAPAALTEEQWNRLLADPDPGVRQRAAMIRSGSL